MTFNMVFNRLEELRKEANKTQEEIDNACCFRLGTYREYESGDKTPPVWLLLSLSKYYGVSVKYILGLADIKR